LPGVFFFCVAVRADATFFGWRRKISVGAPTTATDPLGPAAKLQPGPRHVDGEHQANDIGFFLRRTRRQLGPRVSTARAYAGLYKKGSTTTAKVQSMLDNSRARSSIVGEAYRRQRLSGVLKRSYVGRHRPANKMHVASNHGESLEATAKPHTNIGFGSQS